MSRILFCPPTYFDIIDVKNPFMKGASGVDAGRVAQQWTAVVDAFADSGATVKLLEPVHGLEDMVFAANQTFVGRVPDAAPASNRFGLRPGDRFVVPSNMRYESRRREVPHYVKWLAGEGFRVLGLGLDPATEFLEGHGDLLWDFPPPGSSDAAPTRVWGGFGFRSTRAAIHRLKEVLAELAIELVPLELKDERFYHLDTCLVPLAHSAVLIYPGAFTADALATLRRHAARVHEVEESEALGFTCNGVSFNGRFITPRLTPSVQAALRAEKLAPVVVETGEFERSGGSVSCLKLLLP